MAPLTHTYFASCVSGLESVLANELQAPRIGATDVRMGRLGVSFAGPPEVGARAVLWGRSCLKVMELLGTAEAIESSESLYDFTREAVDWPALLEPGHTQTLAVQAVLGADRAAERGRARPGDWICSSCSALVFASKPVCFRCGAPKPPPNAGGGALTHSHFSALTVKNAVCDVVRERSGGWRPDVDTADADLPLFLHVHRGDASLYRVLSGASSMHKRGYRADAPVHVAALRETLAAGLLLHAQYDPTSDVMCDPMAGSGTVPIEAALIATHTAPGLLRPPPPLTRWPDAAEHNWRGVIDEARSLRLERAPAPIMANDWHGGALALARRGAQAAGVAESIDFTEGPAGGFAPRNAPNLVVTNPPWDGRLEGGEESWGELRTFLKRECGGASAWVLSGNKELTQHLRMRSSSRLRIENAGTSLAYISYDVLPSRLASGKASGSETSDAWEAAWEPKVAVEEEPAAAADAVEPTEEVQAVEASRAVEVAALAETPVPTTIASAPASSVSTVSVFLAADLASLSRAELQAQAKRHGIRANQKSAAIIEQLLELSATPLAATGEEAPDFDEVATAATEARPAPKRRTDGEVGPVVGKTVADVDLLTMADGTGGANLEDLFADLYNK